MLAAFLLSATPEHMFTQPLETPKDLSVPLEKRWNASSQKAETELIQQAISGSQAAYAALVRRYDRMVYSLAIQMLGNREDALEVTQDAFLKAFRFLASYRGESRFSTWLYRIARTSAINYLRRARRETIALDAQESPVRQMQSDMQNGADNLERSERSELLLRAFDRLIPEDGTVLRLFYLQEQRLEEICEIMGWTMSNAKSRLSRARQRLRNVLVEHFSDEFADWV